MLQGLRTSRQYVYASHKQGESSIVALLLTLHRLI